MERAPSIFLHPDINLTRAEHLIDWLETPAVVRYLNEEADVIPRLRQLAQQVDPALLACQLNRQGRFFFVCQNSCDAPIGFVRLAERKKQDTYELVVAIGERELWGHGYGTQAILRCLETAFFEWRVNTMIANVHRDNVRSLCAVEKAGMHPVSKSGDYVHFSLSFDDFLHQRLGRLA